jgi:hypothetical protein
LASSIGWSKLTVSSAPDAGDGARVDLRTDVERSVPRNACGLHDRQGCSDRVEGPDSVATGIPTLTDEDRAAAAAASVDADREVAFDKQVVLHVDVATERRAKTSAVGPLPRCRRRQRRTPSVT